MDEVREIRRKISEEFGHDLSQLVAYYQELETEMRKSGKYKFVNTPSEKPESDVFGGNSGGPVLNKQGILIGIVSQSDRHMNAPAIPLRDIN
jgi:V8-like Glu-specific endopeptidase